MNSTLKRTVIYLPLNEWLKQIGSYVWMDAIGSFVIPFVPFKGFIFNSFSLFVLIAPSSNQIFMCMCVSIVSQLLVYSLSTYFLYTKKKTFY